MGFNISLNKINPKNAAKGDSIKKINPAIWAGIFFWATTWIVNEIILDMIPRNTIPLTASELKLSSGAKLIGPLNKSAVEIEKIATKKFCKKLNSIGEDISLATFPMYIMWNDALREHKRVMKSPLFKSLTSRLHINAIPTSAIKIRLQKVLRYFFPVKAIMVIGINKE